MPYEPLEMEIMVFHAAGGFAAPKKIQHNTGKGVVYFGENDII